MFSFVYLRQLLTPHSQWFVILHVLKTCTIDIAMHVVIIPPIPWDMV